MRLGKVSELRSSEKSRKINATGRAGNNNDDNDLLVLSLVVSRRR